MKGQSKMNSPEKLATQDEENKTKTQHNMCLTTPYVNKYKQPKQDMTLLQTTGDKDELNIISMRKSQRTPQKGTQSVKTHNITTQKTKKISNTDPTKKNRGEIRFKVIMKGKKLLLLYIFTLLYIPVNLWELLGGDLPPTNSSKGDILCIAFKCTKLYLVVAYM